MGCGSEKMLLADLSGVASKNPGSTMLPSGSLITADQSRGGLLWPAKARMPLLLGLQSCSSSCEFDESIVVLTLASIHGAPIVGSGINRRCVGQPWLPSQVKMVEHH
ncbi:hypothetical protein ACLOJK_037590 [Asimina triloba]